MRVLAGMASCPVAPGLLGGRDPAEREGRQRGGQGQQYRGQGERRGGGAQQVPAGAAQRLGGAQQPADPLHRVGGTGGQGRRGTGGGGQQDQGGGEQPRVVGAGGRVVGVQFCQPGYLRFGVPHQRQERQHLAADPGQGQQLVVAAGQVGSLVRQDRGQLAGIQRLHRAGGHDHGGVPAGDAVGGRLGVLHQHRAQGRGGLAGQPRGLRVPLRLPPGDADVRRRGDRRAGRDGGSGTGSFSAGRRPGDAAAVNVIFLLSVLVDMAADTQAPGGELPGDPDAALRHLYSHHARALHGYVAQFCPDRASADDIVQETFIRAWRHLPRLSAGDRPVRPWLYRVARNLLTDADRAARARPVTAPGQPARETGTGAGLDELLDRQVVSAALAHLSPAHRRVLVETFYRGGTMATIARELGIPPGTARSRLHYALDALRRHLGQHDTIAC